MSKNKPRRCVMKSETTEAQSVLKWFRHTGISGVSSWIMSKRKSPVGVGKRCSAGRIGAASAGVWDELLRAEFPAYEEVMRHVSKYDCTAFAIDMDALPCSNPC